MGEEVEVVNNLNYLGTIMRRNMNWKHHIEKMNNKANKKLGLIRKIFYRNEKCSVKIIEKLYKATIENTLLYGAQIWGC